MRCSGRQPATKSMSSLPDSSAPAGGGEIRSSTATATRKKPVETSSGQKKETTAPSLGPTAEIETAAAATSATAAAACSRCSHISSPSFAFVAIAGSAAPGRDNGRSRGRGGVGNFRERGS
uniref:Uncharacterized protein n=1 Tax=Arundo donax TaxID=35708 RepID=A0A0A9EW64_ARUDO